MSERIPVPKSIRFEVFKRDSFKCQYCGRSAPEIVLHLDHIKPVAEGGTNEIMNLITSCADCNLGKGARTLDDDSAITKQKRQLDELNERREQLEMMIEWRDSINDLSDLAFVKFNEEFKSKMGRTLTETGIKLARKVLKDYGLPLALEAINIASMKTDIDGGAIRYISGICRMLTSEKEKPYIKDLNYIRGVLRNRLVDFENHADGLIEQLEEWYLAGIDIQTMTLIAKRCHGRWSSFVREINELLE